MKLGQLPTAPSPVDLRDLHAYGQRVSSDYRAKGYLGMRKTQQLPFAGVVLLFPVTEDPLGRTVGEEGKDFNPLDNQTRASGLQPLLQ